MSNYNSDRSFTDYVHVNLAVPIIYSKLEWNCLPLHTDYTNQRDMQDGIDYQATDEHGFKITIQERFRDAFYADRNDFTMRYTRENSLRENEQKSEFFKIDATYFIYGITNGKKFADARHTLTGIIRYVVVDVNELKNLFRKGIIKVPNGIQYSSRIVNDENGRQVLYTAKLANRDGSSEFIAIDPAQLRQILGQNISNVIIDQIGFY
ncbi:hypothetical protein [Enterococcus casseliflavus]|uniref:hypothetical protein n=1 Tax=Enterococcus casseliflavus TaxID=37734 RepID=UPI0039A593EA